jgi:hypothetical protein
MIRKHLHVVVLVDERISPIARFTSPALVASNQGRLPLRWGQVGDPQVRGQAFVQNLRSGHYELGVEGRTDRLRLAAAFDKLTAAS